MSMETLAETQGAALIHGDESEVPLVAWGQFGRCRCLSGRARRREGAHFRDAPIK